MIHDRPAGTGVIVVTLLIAALLEVVPLPESVNWVRPEWMLLVLVYWVLELPSRIGVLWGFFVGLYHDVLVGTTLGQWGLAYALGAFVMLAAYKRMRVFTSLQQCAVPAGLSGAGVRGSYPVSALHHSLCFPDQRSALASGLCAIALGTAAFSSTIKSD